MIPATPTRVVPRAVPTFLRVTTLAAVALLLLAGVAVAESESFSQTYPLSASGRLSLENINGDVTIQGWDGNEVLVEYTKKSRTQVGMERMEVVIEARQDHIHIETEYKSSSGWNNDGGEVFFTLSVPRGARLDEIELVNGNLSLSDLTGNISASLVNGRVDAQRLSGGLELETVNGKVDARFDSLGNGQRVELSSVNGSVDLHIPADADATIEASTVHGPIDTDFDFEVEKGRYVGRSMEGTLGSGSARVELENVNGSIEVRRN